ncbi:MAG TPA: hypothetical protein VMT16_04040 [Thermoanaerobaculia bacterium]|nr:hypothetical protein [Thermoanaerobaculia bacterium]
MALHPPPAEQQEDSWNATLAELRGEEISRLNLPPPERDETTDAAATALVLVQVPSTADAASRSPALHQAAQGHSRSGVAAEPRVELEELLRRLVSSRDQATRNRVLRFLSAASSEERGLAERILLSTRLHAARELLRERLPAAIVAPGVEPKALVLDQILAVDATTFLLRGWLRDEDAPITSLVVWSPEGHAVEAWPPAHQYPRKDVETAYAASATGSPSFGSGFTLLLELDHPSYWKRGWMAQFRNAAGDGVEAAGPTVLQDPGLVRDTVLDTLEPPQDDAVFAACIAPAVQRLQRRLAAEARVAAIRQFGEGPADPVVSVVVPLERRVDLLEHQIVCFGGDPAARAAEIIYVLESAELAHELAPRAAGLSELYEVPFKILALAGGIGWASAVGAGASVATAPLLLLLGREVFPKTPGWLPAMTELHHQQSGIGALGAKLLYEDDTIQHAGVHLTRPGPGSPWEARSYHKGLHRGVPAANVTRRVAAVSGACLLVRREDYERAGRLRGAFVGGDQEDVDLCLRLQAAGLENWYLSEVELYHLEAPPYPRLSLERAKRYNLWLQGHLWNELIPRLER